MREPERERRESDREPQRSRDGADAQSLAALASAAGNRQFGRAIARARADGKRGQGAAPKRPKLAREAEKVQAYGWGGSTDSSFTLNPHADISIDGGGTEGRWFPAANKWEDVEVSRNTSGKIVLYTDYWYYYHKVNPVFDDRYSGGPFRGLVSVPWSVDKDGKVNWGAALPSGTGGIPGLLDHTFGVVTPTSGTEEGTVGMTTQLKTAEQWSKQTTDTAGTSAGVDIKVAEVGASGSRSVAVGATTSGSGTVNYSIGVRLKVKKKKPPVTDIKKVYFTKEGAWKAGEAGLGGVQKWFLGLPKPIQEMIRKGEKEIRLEGHASETGTGQNNVKLVAKRLADVTDTLKAMAPGANVGKPLNLGAATAPAGSGPADEERRVEISVEYTEDEAKPAGS